MKLLRLAFGIILGLIAITLITESIEFSTVRLLSGESVEFLRNNQNEYFRVRNQTGFLVFKLFYNLLAAVSGGFLMTLVTRSYHRIGLYVLIGIQTISILWVGFFSKYSNTAPTWLWVTLVFLTIFGIYQGYSLRLKKELKHLSNG
jgi:hypothetical protein